jgi:hypothetical protein
VHLWRIPPGQVQEGVAVFLDLMMLRAVLSGVTTLFGSLGVFCDVMSFVKPSLGMYAVLYLSMAMAILRATAPQQRHT